MKRRQHMKFKFILTLSILFSTSLLMAQGKDVEKANDAYRSEKYCDAADLCVKAYDKIPSKKRNAKKKKGQMAFQAAESYRLTEQYKSANEWYERCILLEYEEINPEIYYYNGEMLRFMRQFDKAKENLEKYKELVPEDGRASASIQSCDDVKSYIAEKTRHKIENEKIINVKEFDMAPMFGDRKQTKLYYGSARENSVGKDRDPRTCERYMDIWVTELDKKGNWKKPAPVNGPEINTVDNEGTVCFDSRKKQMFFTRCPNMKKQNLGCDIWISKAKGKDAWNAPVKLVGIKAHDSVSVGHPCTEDGKFLIFASDMPGGFGGRDLWYTNYDRKSETWSAPKNLGPEINTKGDELFPTFALNGDLIFATNGRPGMGGLDLFRAEKVSEEENKWQDPKNLGAPINSHHNDYALIEMTDRKGYFTSERKESTEEGRPDIFSYEMPPGLFSMKVIISDETDKKIKLEEVKVTVKETQTGKTWEGYTDENGTVFWDKRPTGDRYINEEMSYTIDIAKEGFYENPTPFELTTVGLPGGQDFVVDMGLFPIVEEIILPEMQWVLNEWTPVVDSTINSLDSLEYVYELLTEFPGLALELSSHTDSRGGNGPNQKLSENRARRCYKYLVEEKGIDPRRIVPVGKGEDKPRTVYLMNGEYLGKQPAEGSAYETIVLREAYINSFKAKDKPTFDLLHQMNRRTEGKIITLKFDTATASAADPSLLEYIPYP